MAEIFLKVDAGAGYEPGDILGAMNRRMIRCCHAQHLCHVRQARRNGSGLILLDEPAHDWYEATHQYRFERVSPTEIKRVIIATGIEETFSDKPNAKGEYMDVRAFLARRKKAAAPCLFGEDGQEVWYGGRIDLSHDRLDKVWHAIETKTPHREAQFSRWPAGEQELKSHLFIRVDDFDDNTAAALVAPEVDDTDPENVAILKKRQHSVDWEARLGMTPAERVKARDKGQPLDIRDRQFNRAAIVTRKPATPRVRS